MIVVKDKYYELHTVLRRISIMQVVINLGSKKINLKYVNNKKEQHKTYIYRVQS